MTANYYDILGVKEDASPDEIKREFRKLAKKFHPDRHKGDKHFENKFKEISEAYDTLSNPQKKEQYDMMRKYGHSGTGAGPQGFNPNDFGQFFRQGNKRQGGFQSVNMGGMDDMGDLSDILSQLFGGGGGQSPFGNQQQKQHPFGFGQHQNQPTRGHDLKANLSISFMEMVNGTERTIKVGGKKIKIKIPKGIKNRDKIKLHGMGQESVNGGEKGDLIITVGVMKDQKFERKGNDIYTSVKVSFKDAILGTKVQAETLTKKIAMTIKPGTQPGTLMRLKGMGLAVGDKNGDLFVKVEIDIPEKITDEQRELLNKWNE